MEQQENKRTYKIANSKIIKIYTIMAYLVSVVLYELFYCNADFVNKTVRALDNINYNFSPIRIVFYVAFLILFIIFNKKFISSAIEALESKTKRVLIYAYIPVIILAIIAFYVRVFNNISIQSLVRVTLGALILIAGSVFLIYVSKNHIKNVIIASTTFGIIFCIMTNYYHALDEKKHFLSAFNLAYFNLNYVEHPIQSDDSEGIPHRITYNDTYRLYAQKYEGNIRENTNEDDTSSTPTTYSKALYVAPAMGIFIARIIGGSVADVFVAGRVFNVLLYAALVCIALKITPFKKNIFTAIALLPMAMMLAASYSIDGACIGLVFIFTAYVFKLYASEEIKLKQWGILVGLFLIMLLAKSMAYLAVGALIFILPLWKIIKKQNKKVKIGLLIVAILVVIAIVGVLFYIKDNMISTDTRGGGEVDAQAQMQLLMSNPLRIIPLELNYIVGSMLNFGWLQSLHQPTFFTIEYGPATFLVMMFFIFYVALTDDSHNFKTKHKAVFLATFFAVYFMTNIILYICYTPVGDTGIAGYQPRYLFPIIPLLLACASNNKIQTKRKNMDLNISMIFGLILLIGLVEEVLVSRL